MDDQHPHYIFVDKQGSPDSLVLLKKMKILIPFTYCCWVDSCWLSADCKSSKQYNLFEQLNQHINFIPEGSSIMCIKNKTVLKKFENFKDVEDSYNEKYKGRSDKFVLIISSQKKLKQLEQNIFSSKFLQKVDEVLYLPINGKNNNIISQILKQKIKVVQSVDKMNIHLKKQKDRWFPQFISLDGQCKSKSSQILEATILKMIQQNTCQQKIIQQYFRWAKENVEENQEEVLRQKEFKLIQEIEANIKQIMANGLEIKSLDGNIPGNIVALYTSVKYSFFHTHINNILRKTQCPYQTYLIQPFIKKLTKILKQGYEKSKGKNKNKQEQKHKQKKGETKYGMKQKKKQEMNNKTVQYFYRGTFLTEKDLTLFELWYYSQIPIKNLGYISTSVEKNQAIVNFSNNAVITIKYVDQFRDYELDYGFMDIASFSLVPEEKEVLFNNNNTFLVTKFIKNDEKDKYEIQLEYGVVAQWSLNLPSNKLLLDQSQKLKYRYVRKSLYNIHVAPFNKMQGCVLNSLNQSSNYCIYYWNKALSYATISPQQQISYIYMILRSLKLHNSAQQMFSWPQISKFQQHLYDQHTNINTKLPQKQELQFQKLIKKSLFIIQELSDKFQIQQNDLRREVILQIELMEISINQNEEKKRKQQNERRNQQIVVNFFTNYCPKMKILIEVRETFDEQILNVSLRIMKKIFEYINSHQQYQQGWTQENTAGLILQKQQKSLVKSTSRFQQLNNTFEEYEHQIPQKRVKLDLIKQSQVQNTQCKWSRPQKIQKLLYQSHEILLKCMEIINLQKKSIGTKVKENIEKIQQYKRQCKLKISQADYLLTNIMKIGGAKRNVDMKLRYWQIIDKQLLELESLKIRFLILLQEDKLFKDAMGSFLLNSQQICAESLKQRRLMACYIYYYTLVMPDLPKSQKMIQDIKSLQKWKFETWQNQILETMVRLLRQNKREGHEEYKNLITKLIALENQQLYEYNKIATILYCSNILYNLQIPLKKVLKQCLLLIFELVENIVNYDLISARQLIKDYNLDKIDYLLFSPDQELHAKILIEQCQGWE